MQDVLLTFAAVSVGLERVAVPAGALVHVVVQVEAELRARDPAVLASPCKVKETKTVRKGYPTVVQQT